MNRLIMLLVLVALAIPATASATSSGGTCTATGFSRDGIDLTAAQIGGNVTGAVDAAGCDIGVFYGPGFKGSVNAATITNAKYFGVVNYRGSVDVKNSMISKIGNTPFDGTQHGVGILYTTEEVPNGTTSGMATGQIIGNVLREYQKGGITVRGAGASASIQNNTLTGAGKVDYIAQNGIQVSFDGSADVKHNTVSGHWYTPDSNESCGLLFYDAASDVQRLNKLSDNEQNVCIVHLATVRCTPTGFYRDGVNLTAARIGRDLTGTLDAAGCDIGVFYGPGFKGSVSSATITNAKYFGVVNFRGNVDVTNSKISKIGNNPFDGTQHGVGILYTTEELAGGPASGATNGQISGNVLSQYQKGGITVRGAGATAQIQSNTLTGAGPVDYIAQNGIQVSFGGKADVKRNTVSGHFYTGADEACGLLFYMAASEAQKLNKLSSNEVDVCIVH